MCYSDDILLMASPEQMKGHKDIVIKTLTQLGWTINWEKSQLTPATTCQFIGYILCTEGDHPYISIPADRIYRLRKDIRRVMKEDLISARLLARVCGQYVAMTGAVATGKLLLRNAYRLLSSRTSWNDKLTLDGATRSDLSWWESALGPNGWNGRDISIRPIDVQIETDASDSDWGGYMNGQQAAGYWTWSMTTKSINYRELLAVLLILESFQHELSGRRVQVLSDNISAVAYINHLAGPSSDLSELATSLWITTHQCDIELSAAYLAGSDNTRADTLSRLSPQYEWQIHPALFQWLDRTCGPFTIDRFATMCNTQPRLYNSYKADPYSHGVDALAQSDWAQHNNFVNAPFRLLPRILQKVTRSQRDNNRALVASAALGTNPDEAEYASPASSASVTADTYATPWGTRTSEEPQVGPVRLAGMWYDKLRAVDSGSVTATPGMGSIHPAFIRQNSHRFSQLLCTGGV